MPSPPFSSLAPSLSIPRLAHPASSRGANGLVGRLPGLRFTKFRISILGALLVLATLDDVLFIFNPELLAFVSTCVDAPEVNVVSPGRAAR